MGGGPSAIHRLLCHHASPASRGAEKRGFGPEDTGFLLRQKKRKMPIWCVGSRGVGLEPTFASIIWSFRCKVI